MVPVHGIEVMTDWKHDARLYREVANDALWRGNVTIMFSHLKDMIRCWVK